MLVKFLVHLCCETSWELIMGETLISIQFGDILLRLTKVLEGFELTTFF
jgi:hypothetical protein